MCLCIPSVLALNHNIFAWMDFGKNIIWGDHYTHEEEVHPVALSTVITKTGHW